MERGLIYFSVVAMGAILLAVIFRGRAGGTRRGMLSTLIACAIAVALTYMILFKLIQ
jgi:hypothetical protein